MIGIIDSGVGGLSVLREIEKRFPLLSYVYHADSALAPYGEKTPAFLRERVQKVIQYLKKNYDINTLVIACNTSSTVVLPHLIPFLEEQHIKWVNMISASERAVNTVIQPPAPIGMFATTATIQSHVYQRRFEQLGYAVRAVTCPLLVPLVEQGKINGDEVVNAVTQYVHELREKHAKLKYVLLGCTHYPFLLEVFRAVAPDITFIDPAKACAALMTSTENSLNEHLFLTSGNPERFEQQALQLLGKQILAEHTDIR